MRNSYIHLLCLIQIHIYKHNRYLREIIEIVNSKILIMIAQLLHQNIYILIYREILQRNSQQILIETVV